jgi:DNA-binding MarR family transcriptional regulator
VDVPSEPVLGGSRLRATELQCLPSNITQIVNRLARSGLVDREPDPHDGRSRLLRLTPYGRQTTSDFERDFTFVHDAEQRVNREETQQLTSLLAKSMGVTDGREHLVAGQSRSTFSRSVK